MNEHRLKNFKDSIYITGFMASGKSTLGKTLARILDCDFRDLDEVISTREYKSIKQIFTDDGEEYFRKMEWKYLLELTKTFKGVVSLGGGALQNQQIVDHLKLNGLLVYIDTPIEAIVNRVYRNPNRPILFNEKGERKDKEALFAELKALYSGREKFYLQAQIKVNSNNYQSQSQFTEAVLQKIKQHV